MFLLLLFLLLLITLQTQLCCTYAHKWLSSGTWIDYKKSCPQKRGTINCSSSSSRIEPHIPSHPYWNFNWFYLVQVNTVLWGDTYNHHVMSRKNVLQLFFLFNDFTFFCLFHEVPWTLNGWKQWPTHRWELKVTYIWHLNKLQIPTLTITHLQNGAFLTAVESRANPWLHTQGVVKLNYVVEVFDLFSNVGILLHHAIIALYSITYFHCFLNLCRAWNLEGTFDL